MAIKPYVAGSLGAAVMAFLSLSARGQNLHAQDEPKGDSTAQVVWAALRMPGTDTSLVAASGREGLVRCLRQGGQPAQWMADGTFEIWSVTEQEAPENGWIVIFNRQADRPLPYVLGHVELGLPTCPGNYELTDALTDDWLRLGAEVRIAPAGVLVVRYRSLD